MADCEQCAALRAEVERLRALVVKSDEAIARQQQDLEEAADRAADCDILRAEVERLTAERDRQYDQNAEQITRIAALEAENEKLRAALEDVVQEATEHHAENVSRAELGGSDMAQRKAKAIVSRSGVLLHKIRFIARAAITQEKPND